MNTKGWMSTRRSLAIVVRLMFSTFPNAERPPGGGLSVFQASDEDQKLSFVPTMNMLMSLTLLRPRTMLFAAEATEDVKSPSKCL